MREHSKYPWRQFVCECNTRAQRFDDFEELLDDVRNKLQRISFADPTLNSQFHELQQHATASYETYLSLDNSDCRIMLIALQANAAIDLHNHPKQSGLLYCFQGDVRVEAYDEQSSTETTAILKQAYAKTLHKGEHAYLLPDWANIHSLKANTLTLLIDVFIPPLLPENQHLTRRYELVSHIPDTHCYNATIVPRPMSCVPQVLSWSATGDGVLSFEDGLREDGEIEDHASLQLDIPVLMELHPGLNAEGTARGDSYTVARCLRLELQELEVAGFDEVLASDTCETDGDDSSIYLFDRHVRVLVRTLRLQADGDRLTGMVLVNVEWDMLGPYPAQELELSFRCNRPA